MEITFIYTLELTIYSFINPVRVNNEMFGARIFFLLKQRMYVWIEGTFSIYFIISGPYKAAGWLIIERKKKEF